MVQNSLVPELTYLQSIDKISHWDNRPFSGAWPESRREKPTDIKRPIKKKPKRIRTAYTTDQLRALEIIFSQSKYVTSERRQEISKALNIGDKSVKIWFQNRRMKEKRESSESSSDSSNEASVCEMSPPLLHPTELQNLQEATGNVNHDSVQLHTSETCIYQVPNININCPNNEQSNTPRERDSIITNGMQSYYCNNLYPTQYYPPNSSSYLNDYTYYQYQEETAMYNNYWTSNNADSSYFYN